MKKISKLFMVFVSAVVASLVFFGAANTVLQAEAGELVGKIDTTQVPTWVKGHEETVKTKFIEAYNEAGFTGQPATTILPLDLMKARVMLYQRVGDEGAIFLNEVDGKAFTTDNKAMLDIIDGLAPENQSVLMSIVEVGGVEYFVSDTGITSLVEGVATAYQYEVGIGTGLVYADIIENDFTKAYKFAENYYETGLGLPTGPVTMNEYTTYDLKSNGFYADGKTTSAKKYYIQPFDNGYVMQARMTTLTGTHLAVQHGAAPILNEMYSKVVGLADNATFNKTGAPVSMQYIIDGVTYQNFEYGYVKYGTDGVATFVEDKVVDDQGTEMNRRIGAGESFNNWNKTINNSGEYKIVWERLRVGQNIRNVAGDIIRRNLALGTPASDIPFYTDDAITHVAHEADQMGIHLRSNKGTGIDAWGTKTFIVQGPWYAGAHEIAPKFNLLNVTARADVGRVVADSVELYNAYYQQFEKGYMYYDGVAADAVVLFGDTLTTFMGENTTFEAALLANGVAEAEHTVKWLNPDGTVIREDKVAHGTAAVPPTAPEREGYTFDSWDGDYSNIILPNQSFTATYTVKLGNPETGTNKFMHFDVTATTGEFWYDNAETKISVNATLYDAWRAYKESVGAAIKVSGYPVYADETNLVTTLKWFYIEGTEVMTKATIGELPVETTIITELSSDVALDANSRRIIQDSFADAHIFANERGGHNLGLPIGPVTIEHEYPNPSNTEEYYDVLIQEFENGKIVQVGYNRAAYPIYNDMLTIWETAEAENGGGGVNGIGAPTSREYTYEGKTFQNFRYGYIVKEGDVVNVNFVEGKQLNFHGVETDARFGRWISRSTAAKAHPDFEHEFLRTYELYMEVHTRYVDNGYVFTTLVEGNVIAWNAYGASQGFSMTSSTADVWGQTKFTPIPLRSPYDQPHPVRNAILVEYADRKGNDGLGFPLADDFKIATTVTYNEEDRNFDVWYQNFEKGYIRAYVINDKSITEYFEGYNVSNDGKHLKIADNTEETVPAFNLSGFDDEPAIDRTELNSKLAALKAARAEVLEQVGELKNLPNDKKYITKTQLDEIDAEIARLETLAASEDLTQEQISAALVDIQATRLKITNQAKSGLLDPNANVDQGGLSVWGIVGIVAGSVAAIAVAVFLVLKFAIKKKI